MQVLCDTHKQFFNKTYPPHQKLNGALRYRGMRNLKLNRSLLGDKYVNKSQQN